MSVEIPGFSDLEGEFKQRLAEEQSIREQLQGAREIALGVWEQMEKARQFALEDILKERSLGLCSWGPSNHHNARSEQERLGIFPRDQLHYLYIDGLETDEEPGLSALCTRHYQDDLDAYSKVDKNKWVVSEVTHKAGRLITVTGSIDVTDMPLQYKSEGMDKIFQYFDLPQLPQRPIFTA